MRPSNPQAKHRNAGASWLFLVAAALAGAATPAAAIEFWDEQVQIHGFYETRMSFGMEDFNRGNGIDMYSWLHVLNVETEVELAPEGWGPFDMVAAFSRVEVKYDCVWNHACGMLPSVDAFGNQPKNLPDRVQNGRRAPFAGSQVAGYDRRPYWFANRQLLSGSQFYDVAAGQRAAKSAAYGATPVGLFGASPGPDSIRGDIADIRNEKGLSGSLFYDDRYTDPTTLLPGDDDAGTYLFNRTSRCKVGHAKTKQANQAGFGTSMLLWSPDGCTIEPTGWKRRIADPFRDESFGLGPLGGDVNPVLLAINLDPSLPGFGMPLDPDGNGIPNSGALPLRPGSERNINDPDARRWESQGLWKPNLRNRRKLRNGTYGDFDQNYSLNDLRWNHGASQDNWRELKEIYLEFEAFDSQLWVRAGKQTIVWGKTELFRNQDQWNPVDIAIGPLASLEEARIALLALRGIWSFYEVGPLEDVRLELVGVIDEFEPVDLGRCGEPFVPRVACGKPFALWVHGETGAGIAGEIRPEDGWDDTSGIEVGARLEFRYDRFSFSVTDYWGYSDFPHIEQIFTYDRNVDPITGRPRHTDTTGRCLTGTEEPCLYPGHAPLRDGESGDVVEIHSINQSLFAWACNGTVALVALVDTAACAFTLFNSTENLQGLGAASIIFSSIVADSEPGRVRWRAVSGDLLGGSLIETALDDAFGPGGTDTLDIAADGRVTPLVRLVNNAPPGFNEGDVDSTPGGLDRFLTPQQEAFAGCGLFYFTDCDTNGIDLANAAADVLLQSFPMFEGTYFNPSWDTANAGLAQPGTVDAVFNDGPGGGVDSPFSKPGQVETGPVGSRYENGVAYVLPGAHYDPVAFQEVLANAANNGVTIDSWVLDNLAGHDVAVDGSTCGRAGDDFDACARHPFTGQVFSSEMAAFSWNLLMLTTTLAAEEDPTSIAVLDRNNPLALGRCSYRQPQYCAFVSALAAQAAVTRNDIRAGGNGRFGRRNFLWSSVGDLAFNYEKRNILGFSMDFAEDTTKSSWGVEFTYVDDAITADGDSGTGNTDVDEYNLTLSVDRPTFISFLNANRTFFINGQLFMSYVQGYGKNMTRDGPLTSLLLLNAQTGYFQDRFLVSAAGVYDFTSQSSAFLPSVVYRFTENFSITVGAAVLAGKWKGGRDIGITQIDAASSSRINDTNYVENGISAARDLDNFFMRLRYTF
jgi:hypothetical protein